MKRLAFCLIVCLFSVLTLAQERVEKRVELKNGIVLTGYVQVQPDGSYQVETSAGDKLVFTQAEVARVVNVNPSLTPETNDYYEGKTVYKKGGALCFYATNEPLTQKDFSTFQQWEKYQKAQKKWKTGNTIAIASSFSLGAGVGLMTPYLLAEYIAIGSVEYKDSYESCLFIGGALAGVSTALLVTGLIIKGNGNKRLVAVRDSYNQNPGYALNFGVQQYGVGLALHF